MTHVENLMRIWKSAADEAKRIAEHYRGTDPVTCRAGETSDEVHRQCAIQLAVALRRDAADLADEPWDYEAESDRAERLAEAKSDHDFERKGDGR